jgi:SAM-dependent methyltransferase
VNEQEIYDKAEATIERIYERNDGDESIEQYHERHGVKSMLILTVTSYYNAFQEVERFWPRIKDKTVVEIGAGVGMLSLHMAKFAKRVFAIEADPSWSSVFVDVLYGLKPPNLTFIFGSAEELIGLIRADVAVVYTRSDIEGMTALARRFAPEVIAGPLASFDERHRLDQEDLEFIERVAARLKLSDLGARGFDGDALNAAIQAEERLAELRQQKGAA